MTMRRTGPVAWAVAAAMAAGLSAPAPRAWGAASAPPAPADGPVLQRIQASGVLRVCIWPEYYGITYRHPRDETLSGLDIDLSNELAKDLAVRLRYVESSFQ